MIIDIPRQNPFFQANDGDLKGTIFASRNLDLNKSAGKVRPSQKILTTSDSSVSADDPQETLAGFAEDAGTYFGVGATVYQTSDVNDPFVKDTASGVPTGMTSGLADIKGFSDDLYVAYDSTLYKRQAGAWSTVTTGMINENSIMEVYANRLYVANGDRFVYSNSTADVFQLNGSFTLDLNSAEFENLQISCMRAVTNGLWIGMMHTAGGRAKMVFWDGVTEDTPEVIIEVDAGMVMAMTIKDDIPYIMDSLGVLSANNGSYFTQVAQIDLGFKQLHNFDATGGLRWLHHNGMQTIRNEIVMAINTRPDEGFTIPSTPKLPSGIYAYNKEYGIYHKHSVGPQTDTTTVTEYGQVLVPEMGSIFSQLDNVENATRTTQTDFVASYSYYDASGTQRYAVGILDTLGFRESLNKTAVLTTTQIQSEEITETWQKFIAMVRPMQHTTDKIVVKYRKHEYTPEDISVTWVNTTSFTSTDVDLAAVKTIFDAQATDADYEVEVLSGSGAGMMAHITAITESGGTYTITLDETFTGVLVSNVGTVRIDRWNKLRDMTDEDETDMYKIFRPDKTSTWIQFKVYMFGKDIEVDRLISVSKVNAQYGN